MNPEKIIQQLESNNSSLFKQDVLAQNIDNQEFINGATKCLDPLITFGVKQVPFSEQDGTGITFDEFNDLATDLEFRQLTGHAARDAIQALCDKATNEQWNDWYRRILIKESTNGTIGTVEFLSKTYVVVLVLNCLIKYKRILYHCLVVC